MSSLFDREVIRGNVSEWLFLRDPESINELMKWSRPLMRSIADRDLDKVLRSRVDPSDIIQETCCDVFRAMPRIAATNRYQFWVYVKNISTAISTISRIKNSRSSRDTYQ